MMGSVNKGNNGMISLDSEGKVIVMIPFFTIYDARKILGFGMLFCPRKTQSIFKHVDGLKISVLSKQGSL
jgi:hypothetical protein